MEPWWAWASFQHALPQRKFLPSVVLSEQRGQGRDPDCLGPLRNPSILSSFYWFFADFWNIFSFIFTEPLMASDLGQHRALCETGHVLASIHSYAKITSLILFCVIWEAQSSLLHPEIIIWCLMVLQCCAAASCCSPHEPAVDPFTQQPGAFLFLLFVCSVPLSHGQATSFTHLLLRFSFSTWLVSPEIWWILPCSGSCQRSYHCAFLT